MVQRVAVIGLGLIGTSICRAWARTGRMAKGFDTNEEFRNLVLSQKWAVIADSIEEAVDQAELVVLAVPVQNMAEVAQSMMPYIQQGAQVTDVGSMKRAAVAAVTPHLKPGITFIPAHPIAGREKSGPLASDPDLFDGHYCVLTPPSTATPYEVEQVDLFWQALKMKTKQLSAEEHDRVLATTSHLPHLLSYAFANSSSELGENLVLSAGSYKDLTRIAASSPDLWAHILMENREPLLDALSSLQDELKTMREALVSNDETALLSELQVCSERYLSKVRPIIYSKF